MLISHFFEDSLGAVLANARWSWGAVNPTTNQVFLRVWSDQLKTVRGVERITILGNTWGGASPGFPERVRHVEASRNGAEGFGVLCTAKLGHSLGNRKIESFERNYLLRLGDLIQGKTRVYAKVIDRVPTIEIAKRRTSHCSIVSDLRSILLKRNNVTTRETLANARVGQGAFRASVRQMWDSRCCVTGTTILDAIRASHIKPWKDSSDDERLNPANGLPLIATLDALFDAGLISFALDGRLLVSKRIKSDQRMALGLNRRNLLRRPSRATAQFLEFHRKHRFVPA